MTGNGNRSDAQLIRFLCQHGRISDEVARAAEASLAAAENAPSAIEFLVRGGHLSEEELANELAARLRIPYVNLAAVALDTSVTSLVKEDIVSRYGVVPLRLHNGKLTVATANPLDREGLRAVEFASGHTVRAEVATHTAVRDAIKHAYHLEDSLNQYLDGVPSEADAPITELHEESTDLRQLVRGTQLPPVVKLLNLILVDGVRAGASDIHIESGLAEVRVRYRVDGVLQESFHLPKWVQDPLTARCKVLANLDITERRVPQDGRIRIRYHDKMVDLRVSSLPTQFGEKVTMRILDPSAAPTSLASLHLKPRDLQVLRQAIARPQGIVLVTGPTGSGKTTTLYGMIAELVSPTRNIVTIENPIEYQLRGLNQVEINEKQGLTFAGTLRSILRQDPDIILVGEIRDAETAEIAIRAAQTGHLVLSTLHTNDAVATVYRLIDLGIDPYLIAASIHVLVAQRLVRKVCTVCTEAYTPDPVALDGLQLQGTIPEFRRGRGCGACRKSGYSGREAVFEVMPMTKTLAKLIESRAPESTTRRQARAEGMVTLYENAVAKIRDGTTTVEEVTRVIDVFQGGLHCPSCNESVEEAYAVCPNCSTPLHNLCPGCSKPMNKEWQACPYCGEASVTKAAPPPAPADQSVPAPAPQSAAPRRYRALVVDDEPDFLRLMEVFLQRSGIPFDVETAANGRQALEIVEEQLPDLILLDIMMPEMDGFDVCKQLRSSVRTAFIPILMLTALDDTVHRTRGYQVGTDDYIAKPFDRAELLARVTRIMRRTYGAGDLPTDTLAERRAAKKAAAKGTSTRAAMTL